VKQLVVFQRRPVSRLRYTQLGVWARLLTRTSSRGGSRVGKVGGVGTGCKVVARPTQKSDQGRLACAVSQHLHTRPSYV
jgi:hypothetical protein